MQMWCDAQQRKQKLHFYLKWKKMCSLQNGIQLGLRKRRETGSMALDALEGVHKAVTSLADCPENDLDAPDNDLDALDNGNVDGSANLLEHLCMWNLLA